MKNVEIIYVEIMMVMNTKRKTLPKILDEKLSGLKNNCTFLNDRKETKAKFQKKFGFSVFRMRDWVFPMLILIAN